MLRTASTHDHRPISRIDVAAACASHLLPRIWIPRIDQARLDLKAVVDSFAGRHALPFRNTQRVPRPPPPLAAIDPIEHLLPKVLARRYVTTRRDLQFLTLSLRGKHPPPFHSRHRPAPENQPRPTDTPSLEFLPFRVVDVRRPIPDAVTIEIEPPSGAVPGFRPGQFLSFHVHVEGVAHQRAYSICSLPSQLPRMAITVKRVPGGIVSNYLIEHLRPGDLLSARGPSGSFGISNQTGDLRHLALVAAGSGITPMIPIMHDVLRRQPSARVDLLFGNRSERSILFREHLDACISESDGRLSVRHVLSRPSETWSGARGRIDAEALSDWLEEIDAGEEATEYLLCGPEAMMQHVREVLTRRGVSEARIRQERFVTPRTSARNARPRSPQAAVYEVGGRSHDLIVPPGKSLLQAGLDAGIPLGYSCAMGGCGTCKVKLRGGSVHMDEPNALTSHEREEGYVLACIAHPLEPVEVESA